MQTPSPLIPDTLLRIALCLALFSVACACGAPMMEPPLLGGEALPSPPDIEHLAPTASAAAPREAARVVMEGAAPRGLVAQLGALPAFTVVESGSPADLRIAVVSESAQENALSEVSWVYALVAPFPTVRDEVSLAEVRRTWQGRGVTVGLPLMMSAETRQIWAQRWGEPAQNGVQVVAAEALLEQAWKDTPSWAIVPFEALEPRWKVLRVDGFSPLERDLSNGYPLTVRYGIYSETETPAAHLPALRSNRDEEKLTRLVLTGTTALVRNIALQMEEFGISYPAEGVREWLRSADITHISNEAPFYTACPPARPLRSEMRFCSAPEYIQLLEAVGADVIELTGNHLLDWGPAAFLETLALYRAHPLAYYGGGADADEAWQPYRVIDHGNQLALVGCNAMGPEVNWATADTPGAARCDLERLEALVADLRREGYLPIVTFQHFELDDFRPQSAQRVDFQRMARAGAVIVSGSQSHYPQSMTFIEGRFVHYGLGNLFFDQTSGGHEREFIDRHIFYEGRHISTELLTARLSPDAQPIPMTDAERRDLLEDAFNAAVW